MKIPVALTLAVLFCTPLFALRGYYVGLHGGMVTPNNAATDQGLGYGADVGLRLTKSFDVTTTFNASNQPSGLLMWNAGSGVELRMFRGMADMELTLGAGAAAYSLALNGINEMKFGVNGGITLDFVMSRSFHLGTQIRFHAFSGGGNANITGFQTFMVRLGYFWSTSDSTLTLPDMQ